MERLGAPSNAHRVDGLGHAPFHLRRHVVRLPHRDQHRPRSRRHLLWHDCQDAARGSADGAEAADKLREGDAGLHRRGRERKQSASVHVWRREEDPEPTRRRGCKEGKGNALKEMLGLQRASRGPAQREAVHKDNIELDLKGLADVDVREIGGG